MSDSRRRLLASLAEEHRFLQLRGFGADFRVPLELEPIYISLRAVPAHAEMGPRRVGAEPEPGDPPADSIPRTEWPDGQDGPFPQALEIGPALDFCERQRYSGMVVLGDPGSGKTTLLKFLTLCLAERKPPARTGIRSRRFRLLLPLRRVEDFSRSLEDALRACYADAMALRDAIPVSERPGYGRGLLSDESAGDARRRTAAGPSENSLACGRRWRPACRTSIARA
jgi:hypothetical protein